ncbi:MAG TPA: hypothetical protein VNS09_26305 [Solirubrobacter sp.]|nr:hypothetical protein [Solirubrobacter sp.]
MTADDIAGQFEALIATVEDCGGDTPILAALARLDGFHFAETAEAIEAMLLNGGRTNPTEPVDPDEIDDDSRQDATDAAALLAIGFLVGRRSIGQS